MHPTFLQLSGQGQSSSEEGQVVDVDEDYADAGVQAEQLGNKRRIYDRSSHIERTGKHERSALSLPFKYTWHNSILGLLKIGRIFPS